MPRSTSCTSSRFTATFVSRSIPSDVFCAAAWSLESSCTSSSMRGVPRTFRRVALRDFIRIGMAGRRYTSASFGKHRRSDAIRTAVGHHFADPGDRSLRQRPASRERAQRHAGATPHARGLARVPDRLCGAARVSFRRSSVPGADAPFGDFAVDRRWRHPVSDRAENGLLASAGHLRRQVGADPFIVPLAIPAIAGPSALATVMLMGSREPDQLASWAAALSGAMAVTTLVLLAADRLQALLGEHAVRAFERLMGLVLTAVAIEMLLGGIKSIAAQVH